MDRKQRRERRKRLAQAVRSGQKVDSVAKEYGLSEQMVRRACREFGVKPPSLAKKTHLAVVARLLKGKREVAVAEELGVSPQYVSAVKHRARQAGVRL